MDIKLTHNQARKFVIISRKLSNSEIDFINVLADLGVKQFTANIKARIRAEIGLHDDRHFRYYVLNKINKIIDETLNPK